MSKMRLPLLAAALVALMAGCALPGGSPATDRVTPDVTITASELAFDTETLTIAAGQTTSVAFVNDDQFPHNWSIYGDESAEEEVFVGKVGTRTTILYEVPPLEAGEYFFRCDLHPEMMKGILIVEG